MSLVLFLIYLGGMLVVFAYTAALAAEPYPEGWGSRSVAVYTGFYILVVGGISYILLKNWPEASTLPGGE